MSDQSGAVRDDAGERGSTESLGKPPDQVVAVVDDTVNEIDDPDVRMAIENDNISTSDVRTYGSENGLKIKISTSLGKSWVNNLLVENRNGEDEQRPNLNTINGDYGKDDNFAIKSKTEVELSDVSGNNNHSNTAIIHDEKLEPVLDSPENSDIFSTASPDVKLKLNCTSKGGKLLSHWEIMNKCLNKKTLFEALKVSPAPSLLYKCPVCQFTKNFPQHVLFHMRTHKDLTSVFEFYQRYEQHPTNWSEMEVKNTAGLSNAAAVDYESNTFEFNGIPLVPDIANDDSDKSYIVDSDQLDELSDCSISRISSKRKQKRRRRRRKCRSELLSSPISVAVSEYQTSDDDFTVNEKLTKSMTDVEDTYFDDVKMRRKLRKRKPSAPPLYGTDFILDPYDSHESMDEIFDDIDYEFPLNVTPENPYLCQYCGAKFTKDNGIARHYAKHHRKTSSSHSLKKRKKKKKRAAKLEPKVVVKNGTASATCQTTLSYNVNSFKVLPLDQEGLTKALTQLEYNVNKLLEYFVHDSDVLVSIGWPCRNVNELVIDILERCSVAPVICGSTKFSKLQCLRQNMNKLLNFCIKDEVMESSGWTTQLVDQVIIELIDKAENCSNDFSEQELYD